MSSTTIPVEPPNLFPISDFDRFVEALEKASSNELADIVERSNRLRCLENFEILHKVLAQIGLPTGTAIRGWERNEGGKLRFSVYQRVLFDALGDDLVSDLNLKALLSTAKEFRDDVAHAETSCLSGSTTTWIADRVKYLTVELMLCAEMCRAEYEEPSSGNPADYFYELFKVRQESRSIGAEGVQ